MELDNDAIAFAMRKARTRPHEAVGWFLLKQAGYTLEDLKAACADDGWDGPPLDFHAMPDGIFETE